MASILIFHIFLCIRMCLCLHTYFDSRHTQKMKMRSHQRNRSNCSRSLFDSNALPRLNMEIQLFGPLFLLFIKMQFCLIIGYRVSGINRLVQFAVNKIKWISSIRTNTNPNPKKKSKIDIFLKIDLKINIKKKSSDSESLERFIG